MRAYQLKKDNRIRDDRLRVFVRSLIERLGTEATVRLIVRSIIKSLDLCQEDISIRLEDIVPSLIQGTGN